ncbi:Cytosolic phospholipase A2 [Bulinus truncatus]|nr:Cytosolic phospholipase A2 [Bulinus truncatus]
MDTDRFGGMEMGKTALAAWRWIKRSPLPVVETMATDMQFDPYQVFEVNHKRCVIIYVNVVRGRRISKGWAKDLMDTPDPYLIIKLAKSPTALRKTSVKDNDMNPEWNETFKFWLNPEVKHVLELSLMDSNYSIDETIGTLEFPLDPLPIDAKLKKTFFFNETSEVDVEIWGETSERTDLRYSLALCSEEKNFIQARTKRIFEYIKDHYAGMDCPEKNLPRSHQEVPIIGVIGSGGGFRAMVGYSGALSALSELGVLKLTTYLGGLSGSSWYLSQLYSHSNWPDISPGEQRTELKHNIDHSFLWLLKSHSITFIKDIWSKKGRGEPVSFTDLFGHLVGHTLLKDRLDSNLSDQQRVLSDGQCPMPLYSCLHVKKTTSPMVFHEWIEFSPYEIGLPKYGTFLKSDQFACKFFMGSIVKRFPEPPLHFLQGIWGIAFCIQFKRLFDDDKQIDRTDEDSDNNIEEELKKDLENCDADEGELSEDDDSGESKSCGGTGTTTTDYVQQKRSTCPRFKQQTFWDSMLSKLMDTSLFQSIEMRAAQVFNFLRGLSLNNVYPFSPFTKTQKEEDEDRENMFGDIFKMHPTHHKKLYLVDSGLTFNSPYPLLLRPQRAVDLILSFDFSGRPSDDTPPFKDLLLAAKWAELNKVPFPPIDTNVLEKDGLKECYVFKHPWDPNCPIVLHFCLININFRNEIKPGVPRTTQEERDFANFSIFDDPNRPYSTFKFTYSHLEFDRLAQLMEYNTLRNRDVIFENIVTCLKRRRRFSINRHVSKKDVLRLSLIDKNKQELLSYRDNLENIAEAEDKLDSITIKNVPGLKKELKDSSMELRGKSQSLNISVKLRKDDEEQKTGNTEKSQNRKMTLMQKDKGEAAMKLFSADDKC